MENDLLKNRAWIEIDLSNLKHNVEEIKKILPKSTKMMAVVKGNAYGHEMIPISKYLSKLGIKDFAVATLEEGIQLRDSGLKGNILILGYTSIENIQYVIKYHLIQTIVDEKYAFELSKLPFSIPVQIKINTGMNRIGIRDNEVDSIRKIYSYPNLEVLGLFSHLSSSEQYCKEDREYTYLQIYRFETLLENLKKYSIFPAVHLQSSYGVLNYPEFVYDYVRIGMILYGCHSEINMNLKVSLDLKPVLSLYARVTTVKEIEEGEFVGYDRTYQALTNRKIATLSIGYADGYPRELSKNHAVVYLNGSYAPIIGRICMDQMMIDVTNIDVKEGDIATLIGSMDEIRAEKVAFKAGTITNELLSRLGSRLKIIAIEKSKN